MASAEDIDGRAADWLARLDRPDVPVVEHAAFEAWCRDDPRHLAAYLRLLAVWNRLDALNAPESPRAEDAADAMTVLESASRAPSGPPSRAGPFVALALAAGLAAIAAGVAWWHWSTPFGFVGGVQRYATTLGGFRRIGLADGSVVQLNTDSELAVRLRASERDLMLLHGEATFEVAPDKSRPFIVVAGSTAVRAVGTVFNVEKAGASVEVLVTKGVVAVGPLAIVDAGQMAIAASSKVRVESVDQEEIARRLAWHQGMLLFNGQSLTDVAAEFNRYNERKLVVADPAVGRIRIGGYFRATDLDSFVRVLVARFGIVAIHESGRILLRR